MQTSGLVSNQSYVDHERMVHNRPYRSLGQQPNGGPVDVESWSSIQAEENGLLQRMAPFQASSMGWPASPGLTTTAAVKRVIRLDVPLEKFPDGSRPLQVSIIRLFLFFVLFFALSFLTQKHSSSILSGPHENSLKRIEAMTECRIFVRGRGSVKDSMKEEKLKDQSGYEHLNEPLHLLVEAEFPEDMIDSRLDHAVALLENLLKPVDESMALYKNQQLRELAMLNGTPREKALA